MIPTPCARLIFWWDTSMTTSCILPLHHTGLHTDGLRWFDADGLQAPQDPPQSPRLSGRWWNSLPRTQRCDVCRRDGFADVGVHQAGCTERVAS